MYGSSQSQREGRLHPKRFYLDSLWLDVAVVREVTVNMLKPFIWKWHVKHQPRAPWDWKGVWLYEYEADTVTSLTMRVFLSANADDIRKAAAALENQRSSEDSTED